MHIPNYTLELRVSLNLVMSFTPWCANGMGSGILCRAVQYKGIMEDKVDIYTMPFADRSKYLPPLYVVNKYPIPWSDLDKYRSGCYALPGAYRDWLEALENTGLRGNVPMVCQSNKVVNARGEYLGEFNNGKFVLSDHLMSMPLSVVEYIESYVYDLPGVPKP